MTDNDRRCRGHRGCTAPLPLRPPSSPLPLSPPVCPVIHAAMQSGLLCRQNCRDSHLPFPFLVLSIHHLPPPCHLELSRPPLQDTLCAHQGLCFDFADYLFVCVYICAFICVCALCLISTPPSLSFFLSICLSSSVALTLQIS